MTPGTRVRHRFDGARGTIERYDAASDMFIVRFPDGPELVTREDVEPIGRPVKKARRRP